MPFLDWLTCNPVQCVAEGDWWLLRQAEEAEEAEESDEDTGSEYESVAPEEERLEEASEAAQGEASPPRRERTVRERKAPPTNLAFAQTQLAVACGLLPAQLAPTALLAAGVGLQGEGLFKAAPRPEKTGKKERRAQGAVPAKANYANASRGGKNFKQRR